ncbi:hypothetical protein Rhopal_000125-T1 [Rhodotorula paludigena]|uniref:HTH APSES-type domain-containing protein n=1 Tax=Rhodotorula paludigena TaxID=86838 RepID=A0AAV5GBV4_9BASI|nr:hypothetical protein Rhopal_000125-T1 [Rhodotorula paludigena]
MAGRNASKSPQPPVRRSTRGSTPTRDLASPPPSTRTTRSSAVGLPASASTPSLASLVPPVPDVGLPTSPRGMRKSTSTRALSPRVAARTQRPSLPSHAANKLLADEAKGAGSGRAHRLPKVKTQTLHLGEDNGTITIARIKCPVPKGVPGHIIKRFDTDAVSASSLFRAAFPTASADEETLEMRWVAVGSRGTYGDTAKAGNEEDESKKLSGTWIPSSHASLLAQEYGIERYAVELIQFVEAGTQEDGTPEPPTPSVSNDSPAVRSPRSKRARVSSPLANKASSSTTQSLSGATGPGVSILQTLATSEAGAVTETTEVKVDVPVSAAGLDDAPQFASDADAQIAAAQALVDNLKEQHVLADLSEATHIPDPHPASKKKRALEVDADDEALPESGTLADALGTVDNRSFLSKLFRRNAKRKPTQASRETRALPAPRAAAALPVPEVIVREEDDLEGGRRWVAGLGLAVAVGATAAAPYLFG